MVLWYKASHQYEGHDFTTVSTLYLNRYPNPYASHVISVDVIKTEITDDGKLLQTKLISKMGRTPKFLSIFLGNINQSWIVEKTSVDPRTHEMMTYTRNLDHTKIIRIEEYTKFQYNLNNAMISKSVVKFSSGFQVASIKNRIETWSHLKFGENLVRSRKGLAFVMDKLQPVSV